MAWAGLPGLPGLHALLGQLGRSRTQPVQPVQEGERWVVLDVESTGLDPSRDRLLAVAAVAVRWKQGRPGVELGDRFAVVLADAARRWDKTNILVHGIGVGAQRRGLPPAQALSDFEAWVGTAPRLGFHVDFDRVLIERALRLHLPHAPTVPRDRWLDLEPLAALTHPQVRGRSLDDWLAHFGIECLQRHDAAADTLATAELLLRLWPALQREGASGFGACRRLAASRRWLR